MNFSCKYDKGMMILKVHLFCVFISKYDFHKVSKKVSNFLLLKNRACSLLKRPDGKPNWISKTKIT